MFETKLVDTCLMFSAESNLIRHLSSMGTLMAEGMKANSLELNLENLAANLGKSGPYVCMQVVQLPVIWTGPEQRCNDQRAAQICKALKPSALSRLSTLKLYGCAKAWL